MLLVVTSMLYSALLLLSAPSYVLTTAKKAHSLHCTHFFQTLLRHVSKLNHLAAPESLQSVTYHRSELNASPDLGCLT